MLENDSLSLSKKAVHVNSYQSYARNNNQRDTDIIIHIMCADNKVNKLSFFSKKKKKKKKKSCHGF